ncbi:ABC transporter permease [Cytobacillus sp. Hm23]
MNKFWIIVSNTYMTKLKTKSFIISTLIIGLIVFALGNMQNIIDFFDKQDKATTIAVIDETEELFEPFKAQLDVFSEELTVEKYSGTEEEATLKVEEEDYTGFIILSYNEANLPQGTFKAMSITDNDVNTKLEQALQQLKTTIATSQIGLEPSQVEKLYEPVFFEKIALAEDAKTEEELMQARGIVYVLLFFIYISVIMYASMIATEVATEKTSRVMEIIISSVSPVTQMFGKILGIALLSLTQLAAILAIGYFSLSSNVNNIKNSGGVLEFFGFANIPASTIIYGFVFFILGYLLYSTLAAVLGSLVSRIEDVQQMIMPMTLLIVAAFMIAMFGLGVPEAPFITVTSYIPFFTPMIMFLRVGMLNLPWWEIALSITLLVGTIVALALFGAKVYRGGVLMYGKSSSFKDIKKALQLTKK